MTPLLLLAVPLVAAAPVPKELKPKERATLDGAWKLTGLQFNGRPLGGNQTAVWRFEGETLTIENPGRAGVPRAIKVDPKTTPGEFQLSPNSTQLGIFEVKDDTLTIALGQQANVRPTDFTGPNAIVYLFTRVKDEKDAKDK